jgi:iron-sulfur cluster repair protein YtfE (RIC family)
MQNLPRVSHEHHERLWQLVEQLDTWADCLNSDCLDTTKLIERLPELRKLYEGLTDLLIPHMEAVEASVYPTLQRLLADRQATAPMAAEHLEIRRLVASIGEFADHPQAHADRGAVLALRRVLLRLYSLLKTHLSEEELYIPILEDRLTPAEEAALSRALDHVAAERL